MKRNLSLNQIFEELLQTMFYDSDLWIAAILSEAMNANNHNKDIFSMLSWTSGYLDSKMPRTAEMIFKIVKKYKYDKKVIGKDICPDCKRQKAHSVHDVLAKCCPKWWAIRDQTAVNDCTAYITGGEGE